MLRVLLSVVLPVTAWAGFAGFAKVDPAQDPRPVAKRPAAKRPAQQAGERAGPEPADRDPKAGGGLRMASAAVLQTSQVLSRTTEHHQRLARLVGDWEIQLQTHVRPDVASGDTGKNSGPVQDNGTMQARAILGGRYVICSFTLNLQGNRFEAVQILGFDSLREVYTSSWRDSGSTWAVTCEGEPGERADVLILRGTLVDAQSPRGRAFRCTLDVGDGDAIQVTIHEGSRGSEVLVQSQQWTRR
ncbi:MAG: DUF1579 family protein [Planctomycetota bacterium]